MQCENGTLLQVSDEQIYSLKEKLPRKVQVKVKVGHSQCTHSLLACCEVFGTRGDLLTGICVVAYWLSKTMPLHVENECKEDAGLLIASCHLIS